MKDWRGVHTDPHHQKIFILQSASPRPSTTTTTEHIHLQCHLHLRRVFPWTVPRRRPADADAQRLKLNPAYASPTSTPTPACIRFDDLTPLLPLSVTVASSCLQAGPSPAPVRSQIRRRGTVEFGVDRSRGFSVRPRLRLTRSCSCSNVHDALQLTASAFVCQ